MHQNERIKHVEWISIDLLSDGDTREIDVQYCNAMYTQTHIYLYCIYVDRFIYTYTYVCAGVEMDAAVRGTL